ncbi:MAG: UDPglucose--hexose-phosphate uridylyltransferase, partial [Actinomycetota bacterium]
VVQSNVGTSTASPDAPSLEAAGPYEVGPSLGESELVVYSDDHFTTLGELPLARVRLLVDVWAQRYRELSARDDVNYVFVFENRAESLGGALDHPHGRIYAYPEIPPLPAQELATASAYIALHGTCVLCDVVAEERMQAARVVNENEGFVAYVPFAARLPYEVTIAARRHAPSLLDLSDPERDHLAALLLDLVQRYDALFGTPLLYVMAMHQTPTNDGQHLGISHLHIEFTPIDRLGDRLNYALGAELGAGSFVNDVLPEEAASALRAAR